MYRFIKMATVSPADLTRQYTSVARMEDVINSIDLRNWLAYQDRAKVCLTLPREIIVSYIYVISMVK